MQGTRICECVQRRVRMSTGDNSIIRGLISFILALSLALRIELTPLRFPPFLITVTLLVLKLVFVPFYIPNWSGAVD